jgi:hypothetical protein
MNVLKALAKMTKLAAHLRSSWEMTCADLKSVKEKLEQTEGVAAERDTRIKSLEAKLYAAEQKALAPSADFTAAIPKLKELGYVWNGMGWVPPAVPLSGRAPSAEKKLGELGYSWFNNQWVGAPTLAPVPTIDWESEPWATHYLSAPGQKVFAELVDGVYQGSPDTAGSFGRLCFHVGLGTNDFKVSAVRPGYTGPLTRGLQPPVLPDLPPALTVPTTIPRPAGTLWRDATTRVPPKDMTQAVDVVLFNGEARTAPAEELEWNESSVGVAWWRFTQAQDV